MFKIFDIKFESSEGLRKALNISSCKWCKNAEIKDILRVAFPEFTNSQIKSNLLYFMKHGKFKVEPVGPRALYQNYKKEFGCALPYDFNGHVFYEEPEPPKEKQVNKEENYQSKQLKVEVMSQQNDELSQIKKMLLNEIAIIQNASNYTNGNGEIDAQKADMLFKRAETVSNLASSLDNMRKTEIAHKKLHLDAVKIALDHGYDVKVNDNLLGVEINEHSR